MKTKQTTRILNYMLTEGGITQLDAMREFGCSRLGARIWDLKSSGYNIKKVMEKSKNRYGETVSYAKYYLAD